MSMLRAWSFVLVSGVLVAGAMAASPQQEGKSRDSGVGDPDKFFMTMAAMNNIAEVETGRLAAEKAQSPEVKKFAQEMVQDHSAANAELTALAKKKGVELPTKAGESHAMAAEHLSRLQGEEFDQEYMGMMVADHAKAVALFKHKAKHGKDADTRAWASLTVKTLEHHLQEAKQVHEQLGSPSPAKKR